VQGNVVILPEVLASDFLRFCQLNPKPCPVLAVGAPGDPALPTLSAPGANIDMRCDVPRYRVFRKGELVEEPTDIRHLWRGDLVTFILGCSYSFEWALLEDGLAMRHMAEKKNVPMFRTTLPTAPAGPFHGPLVVSMRSFKPADAIRAVQITSRFPGVHGAPVHIGLPQQIGIRDIAKPDWGDAVEVPADELPLFWACGVTPQAVIAEAKPDFCITHAPGSMLVTDLKNSQLSVF
jgi:uncharacterized protein YcsI (UPF0317 family)